MYKTYLKKDTCLLNDIKENPDKDFFPAGEDTILQSFMEK